MAKKKKTKKTKKTKKNSYPEDKKYFVPSQDAYMTREEIEKLNK